VNLIVLGSGTGWIRLERNSPGYLLEIDKFLLLLDCGPGVLRQILKIQKRLEEISAIFISHFHPDHVADLVPFFFATKYSLGYKREDPISLYAAEDFSEFYFFLKKAFKNWIEPPEGLLKIILLPKVKKYQFSIGPLKALTTPVKHNSESLAIRLEYNKKSLVYSGDTGFCEELIELSKEVDLLIIECSNSNNLYVEHHLSPEDIAIIGERAKVKRILVSHFYPHSENLNINIIRKKVKGEIILAQDLMKIEL